MLQLIVLAATVAASSVDALTTVKMAQSAPPTANTLPKDLAGLSLEMTDFPEWTGSAGQPNAFVNQLMNNIQSLTGVPPPIRVGGSSSDKAFLNSSVDVISATIPPASATNAYPAATRLDLNPDTFYELSANFPSGTGFTWGLNLESLNKSESLAQAAAVYKAFYGSGNQANKKVYLESFELGNEPDFYTRRQIGGPYTSFDPFNYTTYWSDFAQAIADKLSLGKKNSPTFIMPSITGLPFNGAPSGPWYFSFTNIYTALLETSTTKYISSFCNHYYQGANTGNATTNAKSGSIFNKDAIRGNTTRFGEIVNQAYRAGWKFTMGEANTAANHGIPGLSNTAEAALWLVDFSLRLASLGITRVHFHNGQGYAYSLAQPVAVPNGPDATSGPVVGVPYYGLYALADIIGSNSKTSVVEFATNSTTIGGYAIYESGKLARAVVINFDTYLSSSNSTRTSEAISLSGISTSGKTITAKRFYTPSLDSVSGINYAGVSFDISGKPIGSMNTSTISGGSFSISASEIVVLSFK